MKRREFAHWLGFRGCVSLVLLCFLLTACTVPWRPGPTLSTTPTWGVFYPTVVSFPVKATATPLLQPTVSVTAVPTGRSQIWGK